MSHELIQGDCLKKLRELPDDSIDATIADPPYLTTDLAFDKAGLDMAWVTELLRVVKNDGYLAVFAPVEMLGYIATIWAKRFSGVWVKTQQGARTHSAKMPMCQSETYAVFAHPKHKVANLTWNKATYESTPYVKIKNNSGYKRGGKDQLDRASSGGWTKDGFVQQNDGFRYYTDVLIGNPKPCMPHHERTEHPTQKPLNIIQVLVQWLTNEGDTILDPFSGSGTTGVAALLNNRNYIGIELNPEYLEMSRKRLQNYAIEMPDELTQPKVIKQQIAMF